MRKSFFLLVLLLAISSRAIAAENPHVDLTALLHDTQQMISDSSTMTLVWWIPEEYWRVSLSDNPNVTTEQLEDFLAAFRPYLLVAVVDGKMGISGITFVPEDTIRPRLQLTDAGGNKYSPLTATEVGKQAKDVLSVMKPILSNAMGQMGENMSFFFFPAADKGSKKIAEATHEGQFAIDLGERKFRWRLPLGSLLPTKVCPIDGEHLNGAWKFCPWHGAELKTSP
jgi:hypothetical protein